ncbi:unnamed protein product [Pylaiella littoralis]
MRHQCVGLLVGVGLAGGFQIQAPSTRQTSLMMSATKGSAAGAMPDAVANLGKGEELFDWNKQWYPVLSVRDADPGRAHEVQLLGKDLVVWRNKEERWTCFDDRCPHRAAPLTQGRLEDDGSLLYAYHGWRFDADGKCLRIPQSDAGGRDEAQPKACAKVYPTQVVQDMVWVWGENGPDAALESALTPAQLIPELNDEEALKSGRVLPSNVGQNDLAYGWDTLMENVVDPSHVPVSHHGVAGNRKNAGPIPLEPAERWPVPTKDGFEFGCYDPAVKFTRGISFRPPKQAIPLNEAKDSSGVLKLFLYATPTRPGWCRLLGRQTFVYRYDPKSKAAKGKTNDDKKAGVLKSKLTGPVSFAAAMPSWVQHVTGHLFLHQDLVFLHHQEKILASAGYDSSTYGRAVFVPAAADRGVMALRKWITKFGSGGPAWDKGCDPTLPPREHNHEALFNVYQAHTKNCASCQGALKNVKKASTAAKTAAVVSFAWALLRGARALGTATTSPSASVLNAVTMRAMLPGVALTLASLGTVKALEKLHGMFFTSSFSHQDNN